MSDSKSAVEKFGGWRRIALIIVGLAAVFAFEVWQRLGSGDAMQAVADELGLQVHSEGKRHRLRGRIDGIGVAVDVKTERTAGDVRYFTAFSLYGEGGPPGEMVGASLRQQVIDGVAGEQRISTGDAEFDEKVLVSGAPAEMLAYLDAPARRAIIQAADAGWSYRDYSWSAREPGRITDPDEIRALLTLGLAAAKAVIRDDQGESALRQRAENDPSPGVRAAAAAALDKPEPPNTVQMSTDEALQALSDTGSERAFVAALQLAGQGDDREAVRLALIGSLVVRERQPAVIEALAKIGGPMEAAALAAVKGEHQAEAETAVETIKARL